MQYALPELPKLYPLNRIAKATGVNDVRTLAGAVARGELEAVKINNRYFVTESAIREYLTPRRLGSAA